MWRRLERGEIIAKTDEWWDAEDETWNVVIATAGELVAGNVIYRRVFVPDPSAVQPYAATASLWTVESKVQLLNDGFPGMGVTPPKVILELKGSNHKVQLATESADI